jgi:arsenate reductase-like glutaredoxin family protein
MHSEFTKPSETQYTVYSKSGCPNCKKVKELLQNKQIPLPILSNIPSFLLN